jgi:hypothetical protein
LGLIRSALNCISCELIPVFFLVLSNSAPGLA